MTGFLCFLLFLIGALLAMLSSLSKKHRHGIEITGHLLISAAFFTYGLVASHVLRVAPRPVVTGTVVAQRLARSRMDRNSLTLQPESGGPRLTLRSELSAQQIQTGERVRVTYSDADNGILELDVLSGPGVGFVLREDDNAAYHLLYLLGGLIFLGTSWLLWTRSRRNANSL